MNSQFLTNYSEITFLNMLKENLKKCTSFIFSVSFIKKAGLILLENDIEEALKRGCKGKIITSTYQNFTDSQSLYTFLHWQKEYKNFETHLDKESFTDNSGTVIGYHSKGYVFEYDDGYVDIIVGSSNITRYALLKNVEWDLMIHEPKYSVAYVDILREFEEKWNHTFPLDENIIKEYLREFDYAIVHWDMDFFIQQTKLKPNSMQVKALFEINRFRSMGVTKALVISAAGSGKTYLAAFDARNFAPQRLLYIVHEGSILKKSLDSFSKVFGPDVTYGLFDSKHKQLDADFLFATNISVANNLDLFAKDEFDYIIIDECHHATAPSYKKIIDYFQPEFLLGLTATPERMDHEDVFKMFDANVPYELRLRDAIINDLVVPFHYYGVRNKLVDYDLNTTQERRFLNEMVSPSNIDFICEEIEKHRPEGKLKALMFCRNITHARMMSEALSGRYKTAYLTGRNSVGERIAVYNELQSDEGSVEILCAVDILNEGVDIPSVNMVVFLRPTESSTVFIQQLGRGLRKYENKPYVTVLDFIGNSYKRSTQIAFALFSLSENMVLEKKLVASMICNEFKDLELAQYGVQIHLDPESMREILDNIKGENFNSSSYLRQDYSNFKNYIHCSSYPRHMDYLNNSYAPDIIRFLNAKFDGKKCVSYYNFLKNADPNQVPLFDECQVKIIDYLSEQLPIIRPHEYLIFRCLFEGKNKFDEMESYLYEHIPGLTKEQFIHAFKYMFRDFDFVVGNEEMLYRDFSSVSYNREKLSQGLNPLLEVDKDHLAFNVKMDDDFREYLDDLLSYGLERFEIDNADNLDENGIMRTFKLWNNYNKSNVLRAVLMDPKHAQLGTYYKDKNVYIFVQLRKDATIEERLNYADKYLSPNLFQWESKNNLSIRERAILLNSEKVYFFVRKVENENGVTLPFTYVGTGKFTNPREWTKDSLLFDISMDEELPQNLQSDFEIDLKKENSND